ncbi:MAG: hypothetical protein IJ901_08205 [Bacteroidaceae bacterium]|nr:hypothetical protein [Bacteroidaceae bacterium]
MKRKLLLATALVASALGMRAQTDVTSTYLTNADFEGTATSFANPKSDRDIYQPTGWGISYTNGDGNDMTSLNSETTCWNNFSGKPQPTNGGSKAYWMRFRWGNSENITLSQETSEALPAGTYAVTAEAYSDDATGTATISANGLTKTVRVNSTWNSYTLVFTLASAQKVTVTLSYTNTAADDKVAAFDNVKILDLTSEPTGISLKNDLGGTAANLSDFNVWYDDYTLEVAGTAGTEITVAADNISYTPEATGTVRFVKKDGIVYVFEGTTYKTAVHSNKADYTYSTSLSSSNPATGNYLENPSFETLGNIITDGKYKFGTPWTTNVTEAASGIRVGTGSAAHGSYVLVWRGSGNNNYFSQAISSLPKYKSYKVFLQQVAGSNATANFNIGLGNAAGDYSYMSTQMNLGNGKNGTYNVELGASGTMPETGVYFTFRNTSTNTASSGSDPVTQIDWIGLVGSDEFPITGVSSASYVYGTAYAPATAKASYLAAKAEAEITIADAAYTNVTGEERTTLQGYIDASVEDNDDAYDTATENLQTAQTNFTAALSHYQALIDAQDAVPDLAYASASASAFKTAVATSASDADAKVEAMTTNIRAYYESHAMAEGDATVIDYTSHLTNYNDPSNTSGWTINNTEGNSNMRIMNNESYTDADGTNNHKYFDSNSWGTAFTTTFTQDVTLPAGTYLLTAKARGNGTTTYKVIAGEESTDISAIGNYGGVFGRGWNDYSVEFIVASEGAVTLGIQMETGSNGNWLSFGNFRLVKINNTLADATDYTNLTTAITAAEAKTLGFEDGEYAPYANADALAKLAEAKAIDQTANNVQEDVQAITTYLTTPSNWTANDGDVDAIYNGTFAETGTGNNPKGWTRSNNGWGQQITGLTAEANDVNEGTTTAWYYNTNGAWEYGKDGVYTMPLVANQTYMLTFKYRKNGNDWQTWMKASVLKDEEGLKVAQFSGAEDGTKFVTAVAYFTTGAAGDYILSIEQNGNAHLTDVSLVKAASAAFTLSENSDYTPVNRTYYETVTLARTIKADTWNTFVVPFDISNEELKAAFGNDVAVAKFSEDADGTNSVISFDTMDTPAITANTPVLLKTSTAGTSYSFAGRVLKSGDAKVTGTNFDFVGTYDATTTIAAGDYFISGDKLYKSAGSTTIAGTRAYLKANTQSEVKVRFVIDDETATSIEGIEFTENVENGKIYDISGRLVTRPVKGLYIKNGKKFIVK